MPHGLSVSTTRFTRRQVMAVVSLVVLVAIVGGVVMMRRGSDRQTLVRAASNLMAAESLQTTTELVINLPRRLRNADRPFTLVTVRVKGDVQQAEDSTPEVSGTLLLEARGRGNIFFADGDVRILRDEVLFNLENLPVFLNPTGSLVDKWTRVETSLLRTNNGDEVKRILVEVLSGLRRADTEMVDGESLIRFTGSVSAEQEEQLYELFRQRSSGNPALHQIARLLQANTVKSIDVWVDGDRDEVRKIAVHFVRPLDEGQEFDFATLTMQFSQYGKGVVIDRPTTKLRVRPEVFGRIFGSGEVAELQLQP